MTCCIFPQTSGYKKALFRLFSPGKVNALAVAQDTEKGREQLK